MRDDKIDPVEQKTLLTVYVRWRINNVHACGEHIGVGLVDILIMLVAQSDFVVEIEPLDII